MIILIGLSQEIFTNNLGFYNFLRESSTAISKEDKDFVSKDKILAKDVCSNHYGIVLRIGTVRGIKNTRNGANTNHSLEATTLTLHS